MRINSAEISIKYDFWKKMTNFDVYIILFSLKYLLKFL